MKKKLQKVANTIEIIGNVFEVSEYAIRLATSVKSYTITQFERKFYISDEDGEVIYFAADNDLEVLGAIIENMHYSGDKDIVICADTLVEVIDEDDGVFNSSGKYLYLEIALEHYEDTNHYTLFGLNDSNDIEVINRFNNYNDAMNYITDHDFSDFTLRSWVELDKIRRNSES